jgi:SAM-dependent methyltransferase
MNSQRSADRTNWDYYNKLTPGRDDYWRKMAAPRFRTATFLRLVGDNPPSNLVDLGCGNGQLLREIRVHYPDIELCGIDLSPAQIETNRSHMPEIDWHVANLDHEYLSQTELVERFEMVTASEILEHLDDPKTFLKNAVSLAKPGDGRLLLSTQSGVLGQTERRVGHQRHFSCAEIDQLLRLSGWDPLHVWNCGFPFHDLSKWIANLKPDLSLRRFGEKRYRAFENLICLALRVAFRFNSQHRGAQLFAMARRAY